MCPPWDWDTIWMSRNERIIYHEAQGAARAAGNVAIAQANAASATNAEMKRNHAELMHDVKVLTAMVSALGEALVAQGVLDGAKVRESFDAALVRMFPPPPARQVAPQATSPYRGAEPASPPAAPKVARVACGKCGAQVAVNSTYVTEHGTVCESCYRGGG